MALAAPAGADTIRVAQGGSDVPDCGRGANAPCASVAAALGLTPGAQDGDVISIGPGDFAAPEISTTKNIRLVGAGAGTLDRFDPSKDTRLRLTSDTTPTVKLAGSGGALERLRIDAFQGANFSGAVAIDPPPGFDAKTYELNDVTLWTSDLGETGLSINPSGGARGPT